MKLKLILLLLLTIGRENLLFAGETTKIDETPAQKKPAAKFFKQITPELLYSYIDFKFNSSNVFNFNKYQGHSNVAAVGGDHINLFKDTFAGLYFFKVDTSVNSQFLFAPAGKVSSGQKITNDTAFGHILKLFSTEWFVDIAGAFGKNKVTSQYQSISDSGLNQLAVAANNNISWFVTPNLIYRKTLDKITFRANLSALYIQTNTGSYSFNIPASNAVQFVQGLVNKVTLLQENVEFSYAWRPEISPFVNGGLVQVANFSNSRPLVNASSINGILPQINLNKDAIRLGGGITLQSKNMTLRLEEKYYNAGRTFVSMQTIAALEYAFD